MMSRIAATFMRTAHSLYFRTMGWCPLSFRTFTRRPTHRNNRRTNITLVEILSTHQRGQAHSLYLCCCLTSLTIHLSYTKTSKLIHISFNYAVALIILLHKINFGPRPNSSNAPFPHLPIVSRHHDHRLPQSCGQSIGVTNNGNAHLTYIVDF